MTIDAGAPAAPSAVAAPISVSTGGAPAAHAAPAAPSGDWTSGFAEDVRGYVQNKGFKDPGSVVDSYRNLEKLLGAPKEKLMRLPDAADAPEWNDVYQKLGRPEKPEGYKIQGDAAFQKWSQDTFHKLGLSERQAQSLVGEYDKWAQGLTTAQKSSVEAKYAEEVTALKTEWGAAFEQNVGLVDKAALALGVNEQQLLALKSAMGPAGAMKFLHTIGSKVGEDSFVSGANGGAAFGAKTPDAAKNEINSLRMDSTFRQKLEAGDAESRRKWDDLHKWAYPS